MSGTSEQVRRCRCGHTKDEHRGRLTSGDGRHVYSTTACLAGTTVARIGTWHAERVGSDRCEEWRFSLRETLRALRAAPTTAGEGERGEG